MEGIKNTKEEQKLRIEDAIHKVIPEEQHVYAEGVFMPVDTDIALDRVILAPNNRKIIDGFLEEMEFKTALISRGLYPTSTLLFSGDSGCGKTFLSKALANHLNYTMLYVDIANTMSQDNAAILIKIAFKVANYLENCILFLDEADSIAWNRDSRGNKESGSVRRVLNAVFQEIDQKKPSVIVIAATNMLHQLDAAFARRFDLKMQFEQPKGVALKEIIPKFLLPSFELVVDKEQEIIERRFSVSYGEIEGVVRRLMKRAVISGNSVVLLSDVYREIALIADIDIILE